MKHRIIECCTYLYRMTLKARYEAILAYFESHVPEAETELLYDNPYQLLVAVILSAQCTDKRVNQTTPALFEAFPDIDTLAAATPETVFPLIRSISYPNNKAKHLVGMAQRVRDYYMGEIPMTVAELVTLPGVGRKTANVITSVIDQQPNMAVDTHVFRVSARLGLTRGAKTPLQTEQQLIKHIPKDKVHIAHHWLILHGRYTCLARQPKCEECGLQALCAYYSKSGGTSLKGAVLKGGSTKKENTTIKKSAPKKKSAARKETALKKNSASAKDTALKTGPANKAIIKGSKK